jgi:hypothetical protein
MSEVDSYNMNNDIDKSLGRNITNLDYSESTLRNT